MARAGQLWERTAVIENPKGPFQFVNWHDNVRDRIFEWETASPPYYRLVFAFRVRLAFICTCCPHWLSSLICRLAACVASVLHMEKTRLQFHGDQIFSWLCVNLFPIKFLEFLRRYFLKVDNSSENVGKFFQGRRKAGSAGSPELFPFERPRDLRKLSN